MRTRSPFQQHTRCWRLSARRRDNCYLPSSAVCRCVEPVPAEYSVCAMEDYQSVPPIRRLASREHAGADCGRGLLRFQTRSIGGRSERHRTAPGVTVQHRSWELLSTTRPAVHQTTAYGAPICVVFCSCSRQPEPGVLRLLPNAVCVHFTRRSMYSECRLFDRQSTRVVQRPSTDRRWKRQSWLVLAHGVEGEWRDGDGDVHASWSEQERHSKFLNRVGGVDSKRPSG
jgi:hypothetical protein